ncbi:hypothetical protein [Pseudarthrobacter sp. DSP2-3-2b1]|uniref:hypothetical protein n=1 Tax=Pseudarthrobacter sp. DSP2-3-2b1 TaxID=2804661 RepID=UPI003CEA698F
MNQIDEVIHGTYLRAKPSGTAIGLLNWFPEQDTEPALLSQAHLAKGSGGPTPVSWDCGGGAGTRFLLVGAGDHLMLAVS